MPIEQLSQILAEIHPYVTAIHIREKQKTARELYQAVTLLVKKGVPLSKLIINDRIDVALVTGTKGVQLAYHSLAVPLVRANFPNLVIGNSIHSFKEAKEAEENGANFVLYGHIFTSNSKPGLAPRGLMELKKITALLKIPVIAIGGITPENTSQVLSAGADGIAVMSGILEASDPLAKARAYQKGLKNGDGKVGKFI